MTEDSERILWAKSLIVPSLFIGGIVAGLLGIAILGFGRGVTTVGLLLLFAGGVALAMARLLELLVVIADHLAAIRTQVGKGVFGLLG